MPDYKEHYENIIYRYGVIKTVSLIAFYILMFWLTVFFIAGTAGYNLFIALMPIWIPVYVLTLGNMYFAESFIRFSEKRLGFRSLI